MATFHFEIDSRPSKNGTYNVYLRVTQDRKRKKIKTAVELTSKNDFNVNARNGNWVRKSEASHKKWNEILSQELDKAKDTFRKIKEAGTTSSEMIINAIRVGDTTSSFLDYAKQRKTDILHEGGHRNFKKYNGFINKLEAYLKTTKRTELYFTEITPNFLSKFKAYLYKLPNEKNPNATLHPNTIAVTFNIFKAITNKAIAEGLLTPDKNPFLLFEYKQTRSTTKEKLNEEEIRKIEELELEAGSLIWHCRNAFLFSFYLAGIRAGDLIQLRWRNISSEGRLEYRMGKTDKDRNIVLHKKPKDILQYYYKEGVKSSDYIFPFLDSSQQYAKNSITPEQKATLTTDLLIKLDTITNSKNSLINKYLDKIATKAGIDKKITFHIARHSFAKIAKDNKVDNNHLKNLLGHSDIKVTEGYMGNFETEETDKVISSIFSTESDSKKQLLKIIDKLNPEQINELITQLEE